MENKGGQNETLSSTPDRVEQHPFGAVENFPQDSELLPTARAEQSSKPPSASLSPEPPNPATEQDVVKNTMPEVGRNAEQLPKPYFGFVEGGMDRLKARPHEAQKFFSECKQDFLDQAFDRKLGKAA